MADKDRRQSSRVKPRTKQTCIKLSWLLLRKQPNRGGKTKDGLTASSPDLRNSSLFRMVSKENTGFAHLGMTRDGFKNSSQFLKLYLKRVINEEIDKDTLLSQHVGT